MSEKEMTPLTLNVCLLGLKSNNINFNDIKCIYPTNCLY